MILCHFEPSEKSLLKFNNARFLVASLCRNDKWFKFYKGDSIPYFLSSCLTKYSKYVTVLTKYFLSCVIVLMATAP